MTDPSIITQLPLWPLPPYLQKSPGKPLDLHTLAAFPERLPACVTEMPTIMRCLELLAPLQWAAFPERNLERNWGQPTIPFAAVAGAELIRLNENLPSLGRLRQFLVEHPGFIWLLGFPLSPAPETTVGFNAEASLPTERHLTQMLRKLPNATLQFLLADSVRLILAELQACGAPPIDCISLDTKHILAWVKENNPKAYLRHRYDKTHQPAGDPDCRLGCKRRTNQGAAPATPTRYPLSAQSVKRAQFYWGYASGIVVTRVPEWGEFVLAEMTQPFDQGDLTYFFPLVQQAEVRLGYRPRYGTFDAAFDAWYVYAHFHRENDPLGGFAAVPFSAKGGYHVDERHFSPEGLPICAAGLPMPVKMIFLDRTSCLVEHERAQYRCPLFEPGRRRIACPVRYAQARKGGCTAMMPTSIGARIRYTLDRESETYKQIYRQRTAIERINSQAFALGIERPHLRNGRAITNHNTLIYVLINLRFLHRLRRRVREGELIQ